MATAFEVGDKFKEKARQLLAKANSSLPQQLRKDLEDLLEKPQPTVVSFNTLRDLKKHLKDEGLSSVTHRRSHSKPTGNHLRASAILLLFCFF